MTTEKKIEKEITEVTSSAAPLLAKGVGEAKKMFSKSLYRFKKSSQFVWHAYLGTAATAEETAVSFAKSMASKGSEVETKAMTKAKKELDGGISLLKSKTMEAKARLNKLSSARVEKVEKTIGKGLNKSLHAVGVPTKGDMDELALLMNDMSKSIEALAPMAEKPKRNSSAKSTASA